MNTGLFITFEGGDGAGKSTQIALLRDALERAGYHVLLTREPGGTSISERIRDILLDVSHSSMAPETEMLLYAAARAQLVAECIRPALAQGCIVICDRFLDSSLAYQAYGRGLGEAVMQVNQYAIHDCMPDLTIYLRLDPNRSKGRISDRPADRMEQQSAAFHKRVYDGYEEICKRFPQRIFTVDASGSIEDIAELISQEVIRRIHEGGSGTGK